MQSKLSSVVFACILSVREGRFLLTGRLSKTTFLAAAITGIPTIFSQPQSFKSLSSQPLEIMLLYRSAPCFKLPVANSDIETSSHLPPILSSSGL